jgi:hypothetical protein
MTATEIKTILDHSDASYEVFLGKYFKVEIKDDLQCDFPEDQTASDNTCFLVSSDPFASEEDMYNAMSFCGMYTGQ